MSVEIKHYGSIDANGKKTYDIPELYRQQMDELRGCRFVERIKKVQDAVTPSQHAFYRGVILPICHKTNRFITFDKKDDIHDLYFAKKFLTYVKIITIDGQEKEEWGIRSTNSLNKEEMADFLDRVIVDCNENGIFIPPSEMAYNRFYQK